MRNGAWGPTSHDATFFGAGTGRSQSTLPESQKCKKQKDKKTKSAKETFLVLFRTRANRAFFRFLFHTYTHQHAVRVACRVVRGASAATDTSVADGTIHISGVGNSSLVTTHSSTSTSTNQTLPRPHLQHLFSSSATEENTRLAA